MKKSLRFLMASLVVLVSLLTLASCGSANIYRAFANEGASLPKSHILKSISVSKLIDMINKDDEMIYVFYGTPTDSTSRTNAVVFNEQARQYEIPVLYYLNSDLSDKEKKKLSENISAIASVDVIGTLWAFDGSSLVFDSSSTNYNTDKNGNALSNVEIAQTCFNIKSSSSN